MECYRSARSTTARNKLKSISQMSIFIKIKTKEERSGFIYNYICTLFFKHYLKFLLNKVATVILII